MESEGIAALRWLVSGSCASSGSNRGVLIMASLHRILKKAPGGALFNMAEEQGFEPWEPRGSLVFKTSAFDHSATPPITCCVSGPCR